MSEAAAVKAKNASEESKIAEIQTMGFRVDQNGGSFSAIRDGGEDGTDEFIGPCKSISALLTKVRLEAKDQPMPTGDGILFDEMRPIRSSRLSCRK